MNKASTIVIVALILISAFLVVRISSISAELASARAEIAEHTTDRQVVAFLGLFIDRVLQSDEPVDFDTRLKLENDVRAMNDPSILAQWNAFTASKSEAEAQEAVKDLLDMLVERI